MLSVAAAGIIKAAPVTSLTPSPSLTTPIANLHNSTLRFEKVKNDNLWVPIF